MAASSRVLLKVRGKYWQRKKTKKIHFKVAQNHEKLYNILGKIYERTKKKTQIAPVFKECEKIEC